MKNLNPNKNTCIINCFNELEEITNPLQAGDILLGLFFIHFLNHQYQTHKTSLYNEYTNQPELIDHLLKHCTFYLPVKALIEYLTSSRQGHHIIHTLITAMKAIEIHNKPTLQYIFNLSIDALYTLENSYSHNNVLSKVLKLLFTHESTQKDTSVFYLKKIEIIRKLSQKIEKSNNSSLDEQKNCFALMAMLAKPEPHDTIFDPISSTGYALAACSHYLESTYTTEGKFYGLYGQEANAREWIYSRIMLYIRGYHNHLIYPDNTIDTPRFKTASNKLQTFDIVISYLNCKKTTFSSTPYRLKHDSLKRFFELSIQRNKAESAYILQALSSINQGGRAVIAIPQKILSRTGTDAKIRRILVENKTLTALIKLPQSYTDKYNPEPLAIMILSHNKNKQHIVFIDGEEILRHSKLCPKTANSCILKTYLGKDEIKHSLYHITYDDVKSNEYTLSFSLYIKREQLLEPQDLEHIRLQRQAIEQDLLRIRGNTDNFINTLLKNIEHS